jgi:hypothetical protein
MPEQVRATLFPVKTTFGQIQAIPDSPQILVNKATDRDIPCKKAVFCSLVAHREMILAAPCAEQLA